MSEYYSVSELKRWVEQGVQIPMVEQVAVHRSVKRENIATGVTLHPFTHLKGEYTRIYADAQIGLRGAATIENSMIGPGSIISNIGPVTVRESYVGPGSILGAGCMEEAVCLGKESMENDFTTGVGFRIRKGSLFEEDASTAQHTDTKMTILFPWVTLGSNINFCDAMLTGGTGPGLGEFTEVGSGTIHFNFTIRGDKATASMMGNVSQGVFLNQERIFLGGNGSFIGPLRAEFGALSAAGIRLSKDLTKGLSLGQGAPRGHMAYNPKVYTNTQSVLLSQVQYIAQLWALYHWYDQVRLSYASGNPMLTELYEAGRAVVLMNVKERVKQLAHFVSGLEASIEHLGKLEKVPEERISQQKGLLDIWPRYEEMLLSFDNLDCKAPQSFLEAVKSGASRGNNYTQVIQKLEPVNVQEAMKWLEAITKQIIDQIA